MSQNNYSQNNCRTFQNYNNYAQNISVILPNICAQNKCVQNQQCRFQTAQYNQQRIYTLMTRNPELFPIVSTTQCVGLSDQQKRQYSNMWWRRLGSQMTTGTNWNGFGATAITGSEVPYTS
jgi:hypothetical protein